MIRFLIDIVEGWAFWFFGRRFSKFLDSYRPKPKIEPLAPPSDFERGWDEAEERLAKAKSATY